jgi:hypothetical protein
VIATLWASSRSFFPTPCPFSLTPGSNRPGPALFSSAERFKLPHLPALALERLPNRDSLIYGDLYGITGEVETLFRATLRYEGAVALLPH